MKDTYQNVKYNNGVSFECLKSILDQFDPDWSLLEQASLYRLAWVLGNNWVNLESFMKAANERNYFIQNMKIEASYDVPKQLTSKNS